MSQRDPNATLSAAGYPITRGFAVTVLVALFLLVAFRHLFGSVSLEAGVR